MGPTAERLEALRMPFVVMAKLDESANGEKGFSLNRQGKPLSCSDEGEAEARRKEENVEMNKIICKKKRC